MPERIAVTGISMLCALGDDPGAVARGLQNGPGGVQACVFPPAWQQPAAWCGLVSKDLRQDLGGKGWRHHQRSGLMACWLGRRLLRANGGSAGEAEKPESLGLVIGCDHDLYSQEVLSAYQQKALAELNPAHVLTLSTNAEASQAAIDLNIRGFAITISSGWLAGLEAIYTAAQALRAGRAQLVLAGGVEALTLEKRYGFAHAFQRGTGALQSGLLAFDTPGSIACGEGGALLRLEAESHAQEHGRGSLAFVKGFGLRFNPEAQGGSDPTALQEAVKSVLAQADLPAQAIDAVFLSANGNARQDQAEMEALTKIFPKACPPTMALKGAWGDALHASGALAAAGAIACARAGFMPPTLHCGREDWAKKLNLQTRASAWQARQVLILSQEQDYKAAALLLEFPAPETAGADR
ncbi:hypothetical protein JW933_02870 [candidate division FCPU426 bacterium]|nr:hypothetical protein [candidate division FCPU426 bacterium]